MSNKLPALQPGAKISAYSIGTLGPLALTQKGDILVTMTSHQVGSLKKGATLFLLPKKIPIGGLVKKYKIKYIKKTRRKIKNSSTLLSHKLAPYDSSLRIKGIEDDLPIVLKKPIEPEINRTLIKSGASTGVTQGKVLDVSKEVTVEFSDGSVAKFSDQIMSEYMGTHGDSGSFVLTADTFEPVGLLFAGNQQVAFHNKLTNVAKLMDFRGFFCPISLPPNTPPELRFIISTIIPDGFFIQKTNLLNRDPDIILKELGIGEIRKKSTGGFEVFYEGAILTSNSHKIGDEGSFLFTEKRQVIGLAVGGNEQATVAIKIDKILRALNLELITSFTKSSLVFVHKSGYWRTRCKTCDATIAPGSKCSFCGSVAN